MLMINCSPIDEQTRMAWQPTLNMTTPVTLSMQENLDYPNHPSTSNACTTNIDSAPYRDLFPPPIYIPGGIHHIFPQHSSLSHTLDCIIPNTSASSVTPASVNPPPICVSESARTHLQSSNESYSPTIDLFPPLASAHHSVVLQNRLSAHLNTYPPSLGRQPSQFDLRPEGTELHRPYTEHRLDPMAVTAHQATPSPMHWPPADDPFWSDMVMFDD